MGVTQAIARFIVETQARDIPAAAFEHAQVAFLDWFGVTLAGREEPAVDKLVRLGQLQGGHEQATILGRPMKTNVLLAALINGTAGHALDYDDSLEAFLGHPSVGLFPGLLAYAEWQEMSGRDFLTAYLIGLEAGSCVGLCAGEEHRRAGWHMTATMGRLASASGCARLLGLDELETRHALGIAGTHASGLMRILGTMCKPLHAGSASHGGLMAALLARDGFTSATDILEGPLGFFQALRGRTNPQAVAALGHTWQVENLAQKYHAACHYTHSPMEAVFRIRDRENLSLGDITAVRIHSAPVAVRLAGKSEPTTGLEAKFSIRYSVANALVTGETGMRAYLDDRIGVPEVRAFMDKVDILTDEAIPDPGIMAWAEIETEAGKVFQERVNIIEEIPPLQDKRTKVRAKFVDLCQPVFGPERTEALAERILALAQEKSMKQFMDETAL